MAIVAYALKLHLDKSIIEVDYKNWHSEASHWTVQAKHIYFKPKPTIAITFTTVVWNQSSFRNQLHVHKHENIENFSEHNHTIFMLQIENVM